MRRITAAVTALLIAASLIGLTTPTAAAAGNDDPGNAEVIAPDAYRVPFYSSGQLSTPASACTTDRPTEWFTFTPAASGYWKLTSPDARAIDLYTGPADSLTRYGCGSDIALGDGSAGKTSIIVKLTGSTTYFIAVNTGAQNSGVLFVEKLAKPVGATEVRLGDGESAPTIDIAGVFFLGEMDIREEVEFMVAFDGSDAARMALSNAALVRADRLCQARSFPIDTTVIDGPTPTYAKFYRVDTYPRHGDRCDPDGQMDGGTYGVRFSAQRTPTSPWVRTTLTSTNVVGPVNQIRTLTTEASRDSIVDYPFAPDRVRLTTQAQELWTDGQWRPVAAGTVAISEIVTQFSDDGGTTWANRKIVPQRRDWFSGRELEAEVLPAATGLWRVKVPGQTAAPTSASVSVITALDRYSVEPVRFTDTSIIRGQTTGVRSKVMQKFSDGLWRAAKGAPGEIQFRLEGTRTWQTVRKDTVDLRDTGTLDANVEVPAPGDWRVVVGGVASAPTFLKAANGEAAAVVAAPPSRIRIGEPFVVAACMVNRYGACMSRETLLLQYRNDGRWRTLNRATSGTGGVVKLRATNGRSGVYRVKSANSEKADAWRYA